MLAIMDLPVEIWMRVFELLEPDDYMVVRTEVLLEYIKVHNEEQTHDECMIPAVERKAMSKLPAFEQRTWVKTRVYYAISQNSRAAAVKMWLSKRLMSSSWREWDLFLHPMDEGMHKRALKNMPTRTVNRLRSYVAIQLTHKSAKMDLQQELRDFPEYFTRYIDPGAYSFRRSRWTMWEPKAQKYAFVDLLMESEHIVLLAPEAPPRNENADWFPLRLATLAQEVVRQFWADKGLQNRTVEVFDNVAVPDDFDSASE